MTKKFTLPFLLMGAVVMSTPCFAQNYALKFVGSSDYVSFSSDVVPFNSGDEFTVELWAYVQTILPGKHVFVSEGSAGTAFYLGYDGDNGGAIIAGDTWTTTGASIAAGQWTHIALTVSLNDHSAKIYINGVQKDALAAGNYFFTAGSANFQIGTDAAHALFMSPNDLVDNVRIWSVIRTASDIKSGLYGPVSASAPGLIAYYDMHEGTGTALSTLTSTTGINGILQNTAGWNSSPIQIGNNALDFDGGSRSKVTIPANPLLEFTSGTIEFWVKPGTMPFPGDMINLRGASGSRFSFNIVTSGATPRIELWNNSSVTNLPYTGAPGDWHHLAFVMNGTGTLLYIDGVAQPDPASPIPLAPINTGITGEPLTIGTSYNGGGDGNDGEPYTGSIDEVRIWNYERTQTEIATDMNSTLTGSEPGLIALYSFDQGVAGGTNTGLTTAIDNSPNNLHGTLAHIALTGSTSNFVVSTLTPLPVNFTSFTASLKDGQAILQWQTAQEQNSRDYTIQRSGDGKRFSDIGSVPAAGNSSIPLNYSYTDNNPIGGINYYRLKESDLDGKFMYSIVRMVQLQVDNNLSLVWSRTGDKAVEVTLKHGNNQLYSVTDLGGKLIQRGQLNSGKLYLTRLSAGMYIVNVINGKQSLTTKVVIR